MRQTIPSEFGPLSNTDAQTGYGSLVLVLLLVGALLASSYPRFAVGVAIGLAVIPVARRARGLFDRVLRALRRWATTSRRPVTGSTTHR